MRRLRAGRTFTDRTAAVAAIPVEAPECVIWIYGFAARDTGEYSAVRVVSANWWRAELRGVGGGNSDGGSGV